MLSVIVPTCNRNQLLSKCLYKLAPQVQSISIDAYEVIVTDDSKDDMAACLIQSDYPWVKWIKGPEKGPAANRNNGTKYAKGEWFVFIDDDCLPDKNLLKQYVSGIKNNPGCLAFEGAIHPDDPALLKKDMAECPVNTEGGCFWSANICINAKLFKEIGGFDESYLIAAQEDQQLKIDIEQRFKKDIIFLKEAKVIHPVRVGSVKKQIKMIGIVSRNFSLFAAKNRNFLGYNSVGNFFFLQTKYQLTSTMRFIKNRKIKRSFVSLIYCFITIPLNVYNFYIFSRNKFKIKATSKNSNV